MSSSWKPRLLLLAPAIAAIVSGPVLAASDTDILTVRVTVQESCSISGSTIDFGTYSAGQQAALDAQGTIAYNNCAAGTLTLALDGGTAGNVANRAMANGDGGSLNYQLYRNSSRSQVWGTGSDALQVVLLEPDSGNVPVYGRIPGSQNVPGGSYTDTVNVTLTF
jgi:spore coat protein U-like protein